MSLEMSAIESDRTGVPRRRSVVKHMAAIDISPGKAYTLGNIIFTKRDFVFRAVLTVDRVSKAE
jgi:hypothetical protein